MKEELKTQLCWAIMKFVENASIITSHEKLMAMPDEDVADILANSLKAMCDKIKESQPRFAEPVKFEVPYYVPRTQPTYPYPSVW